MDSLGRPARVVNTVEARKKEEAYQRLRVYSFSDAFSSHSSGYPVDRGMKGSGRTHLLSSHVRDVHAFVLTGVPGGVPDTGTRSKF
jgi:hypothetical protein